MPYFTYFIYSLMPYFTYFGVLRMPYFIYFGVLQMPYFTYTRRRVALISPEYIPCIYLVLNIVEAVVEAVGDDGFA